MKEYFDEINRNIAKAYDAARKARAIGHDPIPAVEIPLAKNMAERVVGIISIVAPQIKDSNIIERLMELEKIYGVQDWRVALKLAEETAREKFCQFSSKKEAMEVGIRVGIAYITVGVVASPLEGFVELKFRKRKDGKDYVALFYSGPIRSAGGTAGAVSVLIADYVRCIMGLNAYDPSEMEVKRMVAELYDYHEKITNLQYLPSEEEAKFLVERLPVQIDGDPSEEKEVSNYKDIDRIETNRIRNGVCLVLGECLCAKAPKLWNQLKSWGNDFGLEHWKFLEDFIKLQKMIRASASKEKTADENVKLMPDYNFIKDLVAGRPILTYPMAIGGFRLRYGRTRTSGFSSDAVHPATMAVLDDYLAIGTQLKTERPGKSTVLSVCDKLEGPIVKLNSGEVILIETAEQAMKIRNDIEEILFLGDLLVNYGDFFNRAHKLVPCGYNEEWHAAELAKLKCDDTLVKEIIENPYKKLSFEDASRIAIQFDVPMHPRYTYHWKDIGTEQFLSFLNWYKTAEISEKEIILRLPAKVPIDVSIDPKRVLELLGIPHRVVARENVVIAGEDAKSLIFHFRHLDIFTFDDDKEVLSIVNKLAGVKIRDKSGTFIGARMGRPEKAKIRRLKGSPQVLFPVGKEGGKMRNMQEALKKGKVASDFPLMLCKACSKETIYNICEECGARTDKRYACYHCKKTYEEPCSMHESASHKMQEIDINYYYRKALNEIGITEYGEMIKGVKGVFNPDAIPENLIKGILRSKHRLYVNREGTIRYDMTEMAITHFKPKEIGTSIEKLKELGYMRDIHGNELKTEEQILELKCQDVILPSCKESVEEGADEILFRVSKFMDDLLVHLYKQEPFYNLKNKNDLVGHCVVAMSPHTSAGMVARIIGFSKTQGFFAHPLMHSILRRDCVFPTTKFVYYNINHKQVNHVEIGPYVEDLIQKGAKTKIIDGAGTLRIENKESLFVYGVDPLTKNFKEKKVKYFIKGPKNKTWIKITTATNRQFIMTPTHKFMFLDDTNKFRLKNASMAAVSDKVALLENFKPKINAVLQINLVKSLAENVPLKEQRKIRLRGGHKFFRLLLSKLGSKKIISLLALKGKKSLYHWYSDMPLDCFKKLVDLKLATYNLPKHIYLGTSFSKVRYNIHFKIDNSLASLLGYYAAEGHSRQTFTVTQISFRIGNTDIQRRIACLIKKVFGLSPVLEEDNTKISICHKLPYLIFNYCFNAGSNA